MKMRGRVGVGNAALAAVALVIVAAAVASAFVLHSSTSVGGGTAISGSTSTSSPSIIGLLLSVTLNSSTLAQGQAVAATVIDTNSLSTALNMTEEANWPSPDLAIGACGTLNQPVGISILQGNYDLANASSGTPLQLYAPGPYPCPMVFSGVQGYLFQAMSDNATIYGTCASSGDCGNETVSATVSVGGYYDGANFTAFPAGTYTVVAGDEWGDLAISHFYVA